MIPIFRAKKLGTENDYIEGYLEEHNKSDFYISLMPNEIDAYKIDISTLSIHFPKMKDIKGNKIFASLNEDGRGGDILFDMEYEYTLSFDGLKFNLQGLFSQSKFNEFDSWEDFDIIGIKE